MTSQVIVSCIVLTSMVVTIANAQEPRRRLGDPPQSEGQGLLTITRVPGQIPQSLKELCDLSTVIAEAVVTTTFPSRGERSLETDALIDVTNVLKGLNTIRQALISQGGGAKGGLSIVPTQYSLVRPGEKYLLFLREDERPNMPNPANVRRYLVAGVWSGLFYFENDRMQARASRLDWLQAKYEGLTLEQIKRELQDLDCG